MALLVDFIIACCVWEARFQYHHLCCVSCSSSRRPESCLLPRGSERRRRPVVVCACTIWTGTSFVFRDCRVGPCRRGSGFLGCCDRCQWTSVTGGVHGLAGRTSDPGGGGGGGGGWSGRLQEAAYNIGRRPAKPPRVAVVAGLVLTIDAGTLTDAESHSPFFHLHLHHYRHYQSTARLHPRLLAPPRVGQGNATSTDSSCDWKQ